MLNFIRTATEMHFNEGTLVEALGGCLHWLAAGNQAVRLANRKFQFNNSKGVPFLHLKSFIKRMT